MKVRYIPDTLPDPPHPIPGRTYKLGEWYCRPTGTIRYYKYFPPVVEVRESLFKFKIDRGYPCTYPINLFTDDTLLPIPIHKRMIHAIARKVGQWIPRWLRRNSKPIH